MFSSFFPPTSISGNQIVIGNWFIRLKNLPKIRYHAVVYSKTGQTERNLYTHSKLCLPPHCLLFCHPLVSVSMMYIVTFYKTKKSIRNMLRTDQPIQACHFILLFLVCRDWVSSFHLSLPLRLYHNIVSLQLLGCISCYWSPNFNS